jgi:ketosteroid isomerase-like protein
MLIATFFLMINCSQKVDLQSEKDAIRRNFDILRHGYLNRDLDTLLSIYPDDYRGYAVSQGDIKEESKESVKDHARDLFEFGNLTLFEDLREPIISVSPDGKMAWMIGEFRINYSYKDSIENKQTPGVIEVYLSVWEKKSDKWVEIANAQSYKPYKSE